MTEIPFFDYTCDRCGAPFCERVHLMNMVLDYIDEEYCLACLSKEQDMTEAGFADYIWEYVLARDCFKNPWHAFDASGCPRIADSTCHCQKEARA